MLKNINIISKKNVNLGAFFLSIKDKAVTNYFFTLISTLILAPTMMLACVFIREKENNKQ